MTQTTEAIATYLAENTAKLERRAVYLGVPRRHAEDIVGKFSVTFYHRGLDDAYDSTTAAVSTWVHTCFKQFVRTEIRSLARASKRRDCELRDEHVASGNPQQSSETVEAIKIVMATKLSNNERDTVRVLIDTNNNYRLAAQRLEITETALRCRVHRIRSKTAKAIDKAFVTNLG